VSLKPEILETLRRTGVRCTSQRYAVLEFLTRNPVHATAEEIFHAINRSDPRASRATVYNSLNVLMEAGLVREVAVGGKSARFDARRERHHHFICDLCRRVEDIAWFDLPQAAVPSSLAGGAIREYQVVYRGTCERCARVAGKS
jgi:Fur family transcriptional regulator, peroxide stress response regulator